MIWTWEVFRLPVLQRFWRRRRTGSVPLLDPRSLSAHWRRDLGFDS